MKNVTTLRKIGKFISVKKKMVCKNHVDIQSTCVTKRSKKDLDTAIESYEEFSQIMISDAPFLQFQKQENLKRQDLEKIYVKKVKEQSANASDFMFNFSVNNMENKHAEEILKYLEVLEKHKQIENYEDSIKYKK